MTAHFPMMLWLPHIVQLDFTWDQSQTGSEHRESHLLEESKEYLKPYNL